LSNICSFSSSPLPGQKSLCIPFPHGHESHSQGSYAGSDPSQSSSLPDGHGFSWLLRPMLIDVDCLYQDPGCTLMIETELTCCTCAEVNNTPLNKRSPVVHPHDHRPSILEICHPDKGGQREQPMSSSQVFRDEDLSVCRHVSPFFPQGFPPVP